MVNGPYGPLAVSPTYRTCSPGNWSMIARATVSPPTPESKIPIGASVTVLTLPAVPHGSRANRGPTGRVGLRDQEGGQHAADCPEQVRLPGNRHHTGDIGGSNPDDAGPEQAAVQGQQHQAEHDVLPGPGPDTADNQERKPTEDDAGGTDRRGVRRRD